MNVGLAKAQIIHVIASKKTIHGYPIRQAF